MKKGFLVVLTLLCVPLSVIVLATSLSELFVRTPPQHATTTQYCWLGATFSNDSLEASPSAKPCILLTFTSSLACASSLIMICLFLAYELGPNKRLDDNGTCEREKCCYLRFPRIFGLLNFGFWLASFVYVSKLWAEARNQDGIPLKVDETAKATIVMIGLNFLLWTVLLLNSFRVRCKVKCTTLEDGC